MVVDHSSLIGYYFVNNTHQGDETGIFFQHCFIYRCHLRL